MPRQPSVTFLRGVNRMEIGKHLNKGMWGLADKALPVVYGVGYVWLVIRVLPEEEFGNFVLVQEVFLIVSGLATAFALQPLLKFSSEDNADISGIVSAAFVLNVAFTIIASLMVVALSTPAGMLLNSTSLGSLLLYVPAMLLASLVRNFTMTLLQARFRIREVFWMDAAHFLGAPFLVWIWSRMHMFDEALDLVFINIISLTFSSIVGFWFVRGTVRFAVKPSHADFRKTWDFGKYSLGSVVSSLFSTKADSFILSAFTGPVQVAVYNSAKIFVRLYEMASQVVQMFVLPAASRLSSQREQASLKALTEKAILFLSIGLLPVTLLFLAFPAFLINLVYAGKYLEAVPILRVFSILTFVVPVTVVGSNVIMGLGDARRSFILGVQLLAASLVSFLLFIPPFGAMGAAWGYVAASALIAWLTARALRDFVPITPVEVFRRVSDIRGFIENHWFSLFQRRQ